MSQSSYGAMLGSSSSPLPPASGFNSLHQHERMVTAPHAAPSWAGGSLSQLTLSWSCQLGVAAHREGEGPGLGAEAF